MPTLIESPDLDECAHLCKSLGLDFIELNMSLPQYTTEAINTEIFNEIAEKYSIFYTIHLDENVNFCDFNSVMAKASIQYISDTIKIAEKLQAPILNMHFHCGEHFTLPERKIYLYEVYKNHYIDSIYKFRNVCENTACRSDIKICIENTGTYLDFQKEALNILLESPVFGLTFDIGHNHGCEGTDEPYIINNTDKLYHMHIHDALGRKNHLTLGTGEIDLEKYLSLAENKKCTVVLEIKTIEGLTKSVNWIRQKGKLK